MANKDTPFGLRPVRHKSGAPYNGAANPYYVPSTYGTALFIGDPVVITGTSNTTAVTVNNGNFGEMFAIGTLPEINLTAVGDVTDNTGRITGVIVGFSASGNDLTLKHNPASTERVVWVADDPDLVFEIQADGAVPAASVGLNAVLIATHSGSTVTGLSGMELDTTSDPPAADASNQLTIKRLVNRVDNETNLLHNKVEVTINTHTEASGYTAAGDGSLGI